MNNLAATLCGLGDLAGGRSLEESVLEARRRILGDRHPHTTSSAGSLLLMLLNLEEPEAAGEVLGRDLAWLRAAEPRDLGALRHDPGVPGPAGD
jgi:hypothetical protein